MSRPLYIVPKRYGDERGWFSETWNERDFGRAGVTTRFVQDNQSLSRRAGTIRGLHFQAPPFAQAKLVRVLAGAILDVVVDIRAGSPTYGRFEAVRLTAEGGEQLFVPAGFAHGFVTLEPDTIVFYKVDAYYDRASDGGVFFGDPAIGIDWGIGADDATVSDRDRALPPLAALKSPFAYDGEPLGPIRPA